MMNSPNATPDSSTNIDEAKPSELKVIWLFNSIGGGNSLLYWGKILPQFLVRFPRSQFFCARPPSKQIPTTDHWVRCAGSLRIPLGRRRDSYDRQLVIATPSIISNLRSERPDVVVIKELVAFAVYLAIFRKRLGNTKILALIEGNPYQGARKPNRFVTWIRRQTCRRLDLIMTNNEGGREYLEKQLNVPRSKVFVKPFLVSSMERSDAAKELPPEADKSDQRLVFLYVGQLVPRKGIRELIESVRRLPQEVADKMKVWLVGDGSQREALESLVSRYGLTRNFHFFGRHPYEQLPEFLDAADVFVMPTLDDYRALVGFEALSMGLPVMHSIYDGACHEVVSEGENGLKFDPRNTAKTAEKLRWFVDHRDQLQDFAKKSLEKSRRYTVDMSVRGISEAIDICVNHRQASNTDV